VLFAGALDSSNSGGLNKFGSGTLTLSASDGYSGGTTVSAGVLAVGASSAIPATSDVSVNGGTLNLTGYTETVKSLSVASSGAVSLTIGDRLTSTNADSFAGTLNLFGSTGGSVELMAFGSRSGTASFTTVTGVPNGYALYYGSNQLDLVLSGTSSGPAVWATATSGSWIDDSKWGGAPVPNGLGQQAIVGAATTTPLTITLDGPQTVGTLTFTNTTSNSTGYTLAPGSSGSLTLNNSGSAGQIIVSSGSQQISANVMLAGDLIVTPSTGTALTISGNVSEITPGQSLLVNGPGTLVLGGSDSFTGGTTVSDGMLEITSNNGLAAGSALEVGDSSLFMAPVRPDEAGSSSRVVSPVPEPGTVVLLLASGLFFSIWWTRHRRRAAL
jgi:autotransporter-associated beta strand protein